VTARDASPAPDLTALQPRHFYRYPLRLVDAILDYAPGRRLVAVKQVTVNEEFFQGHFPGLPLMPAVLQIEALTQAAAALVLEHTGQSTARVALRGINGGKFRRGVVPGDQLRLELTLQRARARLAIVQAAAFVGADVVAEATLLLAIDPGPASVHPTAIVHAGARIGRGSIIGPHCVLGPDVTIGERCRLGASVVVDGITTTAATRLESTRVVSPRPVLRASD
jgi:beta-hydroxyacyl-ACP dehydratase FabZ